MAMTNFAALTTQQKLVWSRDVWQAARDQAFVSRFIGTGQNSVIQRITELTKTEKGEQVIMHLVADLVEDGVQGDNEREGNEEALQSYNQVVNIDLLSHGVRQKGKLAEQKTVINFRETGKDRLAFWLANRIDQMAFLTLSGISYAYQCNGKARASSTLANLSFAADVSAPSTLRSVMWNATALVASVTASIANTYIPSYKMIVQLIAYAKSHYMKGIMEGGKEYFCLFVHPRTLAMLKVDADYQRAVVTGLPRGSDNPFFTGGTVTIDGAVIHEHRLVYNTTGTATKWGGGNAVEGSRSLLCGSQALGMADLGPAEWAEKLFQYDSSPGINIDKMLGFLKPKFYSIYDGAVEDFGVLAIDHYLA